MIHSTAPRASPAVITSDDSSTITVCTDLSLSLCLHGLWHQSYLQLVKALQQHILAQADKFIITNSLCGYGVNTTPMAIHIKLESTSLCHKECTDGSRKKLKDRSACTWVYNKQNNLSIWNSLIICSSLQWHPLASVIIHRFSKPTCQHWCGTKKAGSLQLWK